MQRRTHTAASGREGDGLRRPSTSSSAAPAPVLLTAVSPQQAWNEQLSRSVTGRAPTASKSKRSAAPLDATTREAATGTVSTTATGVSSVDKILSSSIKQHSFSFAPSRLPPSLETCRAPYEPPGGIVDPVQIRRDVKDSVGLGAYPKLRVTNTVTPPPPHVYASVALKEKVRGQEWAMELQRDSSRTLAHAVFEQFHEEDPLLSTQAAEYNRELSAIISRIQHSPTKESKRAQALHELSPHCSVALHQIFRPKERDGAAPAAAAAPSPAPSPATAAPAAAAAYDEEQEHDALALARGDVQNLIAGTRLVDSDEEDSGGTATQDAGNDGSLVISGVDGRVSLPGFQLGLMSGNAMKESLENAVQSFRSKGTVSSAPPPPRVCR